MATIVPSAPQLTIWSVIVFWVFIAYMFLVAGRTEERRRREAGQPHTRRDTALLLLTAFCVVGVLLCAAFFKPLNALVNSRAGIGAVILLIGGGLTYIFNRGRTSHPR